MLNATLTHSMVAYALLQLPDKRLDCQQLNVKIAHYNKSLTLLSVAALSLTVFVDYDYDRTSAEYQLSVVLADHPAAPLNFDQYADHIRFVIPEDPVHPLLSLLPTTPLYHPQNPPANIPNPHVPCYQHKTCSLEQTHLLLQSHIPDLPPEVIATWRKPIEISWKCGWPIVPTNTEAQQLPRLHVHYSALWSCSIFSLKADYKPSISPPPASLYRIRNSILLHALLPHLAQTGALGRMTSTDTLSDRTLELTDLPTLLTSNPYSSFNKLVLLTSPYTTLHIPARTQSTSLSSRLENIGGVHLSSLFPENTQEPPPSALPPTPTPAEMHSKIMAHFATLQLLQLTA